MQPFEDIDDFFEPGDTLEEQLDDHSLLADLEHQRWLLANYRANREDRAYEEARQDAAAAGRPVPSDEEVARWLRVLEREELDQPPSGHW